MFVQVLTISCLSKAGGSDVALPTLPYAGARQHGTTQI
jgi:hypothetical protein